MSRWLRLYTDCLDDPKVQKLSDAAFRAWVNLLCVASKNSGLLEDNVENVAFSLRKSVQKTRDLIQILQSAGLLDIVENGWIPHNWDKWQYKSDVSTPRVRAFRKRNETVSETPPEQIQNRTEQKEEDTSLRSVSSPKPKKSKSRRSLPEDFPGLTDLDWAQTYWLKFGRADLCGGIGEEAEKFKDHHRGRLTASADWAGSWRTWARNTIKFNSGGHNGKQHKTTAHENFAAGAYLAAKDFESRGGGGN